MQYWQIIMQCQVEEETGTKINPLQIKINQRSWINKQKKELIEELTMASLKEKELENMQGTISNQCERGVSLIGTKD